MKKIKVVLLLIYINYINNRFFYVAQGHSSSLSGAQAGQKIARPKHCFPAGAIRDERQMNIRMIPPICQSHHNEFGHHHENLSYVNDPEWYNGQCYQHIQFLTSITVLEKKGRTAKRILAF